MSELLELREFETITCNSDYMYDDYYKYLPEKIFRELEEFIHVFAGDDKNADILDFFRIGYRRNVGNIISVKNYVGLIQMRNGYQIQVLPKISFESEDTGNEKTKRTFLRMLRSMKDFPSKVFNDANLKMDRMNLYEIFINMYVQEVRDLVKRGIKSAYVNQEENLNYYKGKLVVNEHIKYNMIHKERFYVTYDEYQFNRAENRIIKATLLKLQRLSGSTENVKEIRSLLAAFEMVEPSKNYIKDFSKVVISRNTKDYEMLMRWSKVFLLNKSFTTFSGDTSARALLFPMEKVFESYVAKWMKIVMEDINWEVCVQDKGHYLFDEPIKQFALRPDMVIHCGNDRTVIMDTKWKSLINNQRANYGIAQSDMYQMYAYSKKYNAPDIWLLYPLNNEMDGHAPLSFKSDDNVTVNVFFVDVANIEESLCKLKELLCHNEVSK